MINAIKVLLIMLLALLTFLGIFGGLVDFIQLIGVDISTSLIITTASVILTIYLALTAAQLKWKLSSKQAMQKRIDGLAQLRHDAITKLYAGTPTVAEFPKWEKQFKAWEKKLIEYLEKNFPFAVVEMFNDLGMIAPLQFSHASKKPKIKNRHIYYLRMLAKHLAIMERLIENNTDLVPDQEPSISDLLKWWPGD